MRRWQFLNKRALFYSLLCAGLLLVLSRFFQFSFRENLLSCLFIIVLSYLFFQLQVCKHSVNEAEKGLARLLTTQERQGLSVLDTPITAQFKVLEEKLIGLQTESDYHKQREDLLLNKVSVGILLLDRRKEIVISSKAMAQYLHQPKQRISILTASKSAELLHLINEVYQKKTALTEEVSLYLSDDEKVVRFELYPYLIEEHIEQVLVLCYDVTELRQQEALSGELVANAAHELRTPVTAIKGFTETLLDSELEDKALMVQFLEIIHRESERLAWLVDDVLNLARLTKNHYKLQLEQVDMVPFIYQTCRSLSQKLTEKALNLELELPDTWLYETDVNQFQQVLLNLLSNAIHYTESGGSVGIRVVDECETLRLDVWDTGIGISEQHIDKIFDRFYRVNKGRSRKDGGTGLGLAIVKETVQVLGGTIEVTSQLGHGSCFTLILPK